MRTTLTPPFYVRSSLTSGTELGSIPDQRWIQPRSPKLTPEFHMGEVADWSDEKLRQMIEVVTGGLVRKSA